MHTSTTDLTDEGLHVERFASREKMAVRHKIRLVAFSSTNKSFSAVSNGGCISTSDNIDLPDGYVDGEWSGNGVTQDDTENNQELVLHF